MICQNQIGKLRTAALTIAIFVGFVCAPQSYADPTATDASLSGQVVDDFGVPVTNMNVFAVGVWGETNTFSALTDTNGIFQMPVIGGVGGYFLRLDADPDVGALSRGLVSFWISEEVPSGGSITNLTLVARRITGTITVTIVNGGASGFHGGLVAKSTIDLNSSLVTTDSFDASDPLYTNSLYSPIKPSTNGDLTTDSGDTNLLTPPILLVPTNSFVPTNFIGPTNVYFHYQTNYPGPIYIPPSIPITNIEVTASLSDGLQVYQAMSQRTDSNGTAVLYVCNGTWSLQPDCTPLDEMNLDCQIYRSTVVTVASNNVAITLTYYTNAPLQIATNMMLGTNGLPYKGWFHATGGYWAFTWNVIDGTLPPGLATNQYGGDAFSGVATQEGSYTLTVQVTDRMQQTTTTNVTITILPPPPPRLISPSCIDASQFQLHLAGVSNRTYTIQFTTDLTNWTTLAVTNVIGPDVIFVDTNAGDQMRIYRAVQSP